MRKCLYSASKRRFDRKIKRELSLNLADPVSHGKKKVEGMSRGGGIVQ